MKHSRVLISLLLLATVLVDGAVLTMGARQLSFPHPVLFLAWALQIGQVSLVAVWLALGKKPAPLRLVGAVLLVALWSGAMSTLPGPSKVGHWAVLLMAQVVAVSVPLLVARWLGLRLLDVLPAAQTDDSTQRPRRLQFSIGNLLAWTTTLAVILSALRCISPLESLPLWYVLQWPKIVFLLGRAMVALSAVWAALGTRWPAVRIITLSATALVAFAVMKLFLDYDLLLLAMLGCLEVFFLVGSLLVFRVAGYRVGREKGSERFLAPDK